MSGVLPGALVSIDAAVGKKIPPPLRWLLQKLRVIPGDEFDSVEEVLSLYDRGAQGVYRYVTLRLGVGTPNRRKYHKLPRACI